MPTDGEISKKASDEKAQEEEAEKTHRLVLPFHRAGRRRASEIYEDEPKATEERALRPLPALSQRGVVLLLEPRSESRVWSRGQEIARLEAGGPVEINGLKDVVRQKQQQYADAMHRYRELWQSTWDFQLKNGFDSADSEDLRQLSELQQQCREAYRSIQTAAWEYVRDEFHRTVSDLLK